MPSILVQGAERSPQGSHIFLKYLLRQISGNAVPEGGCHAIGTAAEARSSCAILITIAIGHKYGCEAADEELNRVHLLPGR